MSHFNLTFKTYHIEISGDEWGMELLCDTENQAKEVMKALSYYYDSKNIPIHSMSVHRFGKLII